MKELLLLALLGCGLPAWAGESLLTGPNSAGAPQPLRKVHWSSAPQTRPVRNGPGKTKVLSSTRLGCRGDTDLTAGGGHDDWALLQAALDQASNGPVRLVVERPSLVSTGLVMRSNTELRFLPGAGLFLGARANCPILWSPMPMGSAACMASNLVVRGGLLNCNGRAQSRTFGWQPDTFTVGVWFGGCKDVLFDGVTCSNAQSFAFLLSGPAANATYRGCAALWGPECAVPNQDGFHFWGSLTNVLLADFLSNGDDDAFGLGVNEQDGVGPPWFEPAGRHYVQDFVIRDGTLHSTNVGRFYGRGADAVFVNLTIDRLRIYNALNGLNSAQQFMGGTVLQLGIHDWTVYYTAGPFARRGQSTYSTLIDLLNCNVGNLDIRNIQIYDANGAIYSAGPPGVFYNPALLRLTDATNVSIVNCKVKRLLDDGCTPMVAVQAGGGGDVSLPRLVLTGNEYENAGCLLYGAENGTALLGPGLITGRAATAVFGSFHALTNAGLRTLCSGVGTNHLRLVGCPEAAANNDYYWSAPMNRYTNRSEYAIIKHLSNWTLSNSVCSGATAVYRAGAAPTWNPAPGRWKNSHGPINGMATYFLP